MDTLSDLIADCDNGLSRLEQWKDIARSGKYQENTRKPLKNYRKTHGWNL